MVFFCDVLELVLEQQVGDLYVYFKEFEVYLESVGEFLRIFK